MQILSRSKFPRKSQGEVHTCVEIAISCDSFLQRHSCALCRTLDFDAGKNFRFEHQSPGCQVVVDLIVTDRHGRHVPGTDRRLISPFTRMEFPRRLLDSRPQGARFRGFRSDRRPGTRCKPQDRSAAGGNPGLHRPASADGGVDLADNRLANTKSSSEAVVRYLEKSAISGDYVAILLYRSEPAHGAAVHQ